MIAEILLTIGISLISYAFYKWGTQHHDYFTKRDIKQMTPTFLVGNSGGFLTRKHTAPEYAMKIYNAFSNERCVSSSKAYTRKKNKCLFFVELLDFST